jgi:hypothetical protein
MTDRELLEAAARAAGIDGEYRTERICDRGDWLDITAIFTSDGMGWWNPLTDDGDAMRLAVAHGMEVDTSTEDQIAVNVGAIGVREWVMSDRLAATRRAIVRAAAAMPLAAPAAATGA